MASPSQYQRVGVTATDYDASAHFYYLQFNGTNSWMSTPAIDFTATDKMTVVAGARKMSDAAVGLIAELSASADANAGAFYVAAPGGAGAPSFRMVSGGTFPQGATATGFAAPFTAVITAQSNIVADSANVRVNGASSVTGNGDQGTGNFGNYPLYIGARNGTSLFANINLYGLILRGALSTTPQIASAERLMAQKTGVTL